MIDVKQAVQAAVDFFEDLYGPKDEYGLMLEEVESSPNDDHWLVTLSLTRDEEFSPVREFTGETPERIFKVFKVDANTGDVESMKIRAA